MSLTDVERSICSHVSEPDELLSRLRTLVEIPSPSRGFFGTRLKGVDR